MSAPWWSVIGRRVRVVNRNTTYFGWEGIVRGWWDSSSLNVEFSDGQVRPFYLEALEPVEGSA